MQGDVLAFIENRQRNLAFNGNLDYWQRGTATTTPSTYLADRFKSGDGVTAYDQISVDAPAGAKYFARIGGSANNITLAQRVEALFARGIKKSKITLAVRAKVFSGASDIEAQVNTPNVEDDYSVKTNYVPTTSMGTLTSDWQWFYLHVDVTTAMKERGFEVEFGKFGAGSAIEIDLAQIMILESEVKEKTFHYAGRNAVGELLLCQRYYEKSYNLEASPGQAPATQGYFKYRVDTANTHFQTIEFKVEKRTAPVVIAYNPIEGNINSIRNDSAGINVPANPGAFGQFGGHIFFNIGSNNQAVIGHWTAECEL